jgi:hypothetical protein
MKKVGAVVVAVLGLMVLLPQAASAGTSVSVGISAPGMYFEASNVRPSPQHVWVEGRHEWRERHRVWVPGHWRYEPARRVVYVPVHHRPYRDCDWRDDRGGYHRDGYGQENRGKRYQDRD